MSYVSLAGQLIVCFVCTAVAGLLISAIDRIVTARVQMRVGPPLLQPFYDMVKYFIKETTVPAGSVRPLFLSAPLMGVAAVSVASLILWRAMVWPGQAFMGDLIVVLYLLTIPSTAVIIGAFASRNPLASVGGSREMKLIMAYELPFVLAVMVPIIQTHSVRLGEIALAPAAARDISGIIAALVAIVCMQAKIGLVPFDMSEAETELAGGACIEYSGPALGMFKLAKAMMLITMPVFLVAVFLGGMGVEAGATGIIKGIVKLLVLVVLMVLIRNTAPRVRIDQAVKFFWGPMTFFALVAVTLAVIGR